MNVRISSFLGRRRAILVLGLMLVVAGLMWLSLLNGVGTVSADGGVDSGTVGNGVILDQRDQPPVNSCLLPWFPC